MLTGWFAAFDALEAGAHGGVAYGPGARAFGGATYDPTSHYRAAAVFDFHAAQGLTPPRLRAISQSQIARLIAAFESRDLARQGLVVEPMPPERRAGFLAIRSGDAAGLSRALNARGLWCDARGHWLRLGPAPYLTDQQQDDSIALVERRCAPASAGRPSSAR